MEADPPTHRDKANGDLSEAAPPPDVALSTIEASSAQPIGLNRCGPTATTGTISK